MSTAYAVTSTPLLFARQPILNAELRLFGYEVLYRSLQIGTIEQQDPDVATREDLAVLCDVMVSARKVVLVEDVLYTYILHPRSLMGRTAVDPAGWSRGA